MKKCERWKLFLFNTVTGERKRALVKHTEMLSRHEAKELEKRTKGRLTPPWEYRAERWEVA